MQQSEQTSIIQLFYPNLWSSDGRKQYSVDTTFERILRHGTLQVSSIHQNTSYFISCITTRPKLLINDCVKINELRMNSYCPFLFSILCSWYTFMLSFEDGLAQSITGLAHVFLHVAQQGDFIDEAVVVR